MPQVDTLNALTEAVIGAAIDVHRELGPGLLESAYEACLAFELGRLGLRAERQRMLPVVYKDVKLDCAYRLDIVVNDAVIIEIKAVDQVLPVHHAQLISYLKLAALPIGLLINFHSPVLRTGIRRVVNRYSGPFPMVSSAPSASSASPR